MLQSYFGAAHLLVVTIVSWFAAWALLEPTAGRTRVDALLETFALWQTAVILLLFSLGFSAALTAGSVATMLLGVGAVVLLVRGREPALRSALRAHLAGIARLPRDVFKAVREQNALLLVPVFAGVGLLAYLLVAAWFLPLRNVWDGMWYHDTIVGFTLQNQGFAPVDLPRPTQAVNGVPRSVNVMQSYVAMFAGRRLVELPNVLALPLGALAVYGLSIRFGAVRALAVVAGALFILIPGNYSLATSAMVDPYSAMLTVVAAFFLFRRDLRPLDVVLVGGLTATLVGSKYVALVPAGMIMLVLYGRTLLAWWRSGNHRFVGALVAASVFVLGMMAAVFVRNWLLFDNPIWPHGASIDALGISWKPSEPKTKVGSGKAVTLAKQLKLFWSIPYSVKSPHFKTTGTYDYGMAINWVILPFGFLVTLLVAARGAFARMREGAMPADFGGLLLLALVAWTQLFLFPPIWAARYQLGAAALVSVLVVWAASRPGWRREGGALLMVAGFLATVNVPWVAQKGALPPATWLWRQVWDDPALTDIDDRNGASVHRKEGLLREQLKQGDIVAYDYMTFPSLLFNNRYDNEVVHLPRKAFLKRAEELGATWVYVHNHSLQKQAEKDPHWERVGILEAVRRARRGIIFRYVPGENARADE